MRATALTLVAFLGCTGADEVLDPDVEDPLDPQVVPPWSPAEEIPDLRCTYDGLVNRPSHEQMSEPGGFEVGSVDIEFVDPTRETPATEGQSGSDQRTLVTRIFYPADEVPWVGDAEVAAGGPFPMILYSHGFSSSKDEATPYAEHLASHGFIVVAPDFPLSNMTSPGGPTIADLSNQPGDVSFLIDQMIAKSALASDMFYGKVDAERIGSVGLSLGGLTTSLVTYHPWLGDPRIKASATLAGPSFLFTPVFYRNRAVPLLLVHGDIDALIAYDDNARHSLDAAQPNVNLVTIAGGSHAGFTNIPLEEMIGLLTENPDNPDSIACSFMGDTLNSQGTFDELFGAIQGDGTGIEMPEDADSGLAPCENGLQSLPAIDPDAQVDIANRALLAHFLAYFGDEREVRDSACLYLNEVLATDPDVTSFE